MNIKFQTPNKQNGFRYELHSERFTFTPAGVPESETVWFDLVMVIEYEMCDIIDRNPDMDFGKEPSVHNVYIFGDFTQEQQSEIIAWFNEGECDVHAIVKEALSETII